MAASRGICGSVGGNEFGRCCRKAPAPRRGPAAWLWGRTCPAHPNPGVRDPPGSVGPDPSPTAPSPFPLSFCCPITLQMAGTGGTGTLPISHARSGTDNVPEPSAASRPELSHGLPSARLLPLEPAPRGHRGRRQPRHGCGTELFPCLPPAPGASEGQDAGLARGRGGRTRAGRAPALRHPLLSHPGPPGTHWRQGGVWYVPARPHSPNWSRLLRRRRRSAGTGAGPAPMLQRRVAPQRGHMAAPTGHTATPTGPRGTPTPHSGCEEPPDPWFTHP